MSSAVSNNTEEYQYERVLLVKPTVYVYHIPPLMSASRGFRAGDWNLGEPNWTGRLRVISKGDKCFLRIEDSTTGQLYCQAPVLAYPGPQVQPVADSRRYFVVKVVSDSGRTALIGIGFADSADSFDLNISLQEHFSSIDKANKIGSLLDDDNNTNRPKLDLTLKGDIKLNIGCINSQNATSNKQQRSQRTAQDNNSNSKLPFLLPPPPSSTKRR